MKRNHWRASAVFALVSLLFAGLTSFHMAHLHSIGKPILSSALGLAFWILFAARWTIRSLRGNEAERNRARVDQRLEAVRDRDGLAALSFRKDVLGDRIESLLFSVAAGCVALAGALAHTSAGTLLAWWFGFLSWVMLVGFLRSFVAPARFLITERGIDCRFVAPELKVSWDEIAEVRWTGTAGVPGWVYVALSEDALARADERTRKRMLRVAKRKGAHYRWCDAYFFSSAREVATTVERFRRIPEARSLIPAGRVPADLDLASAPVQVEPKRAIPVAVATQRPMSEPDLDGMRRRAGIVAVVGAALRAIGYFLPWIVVAGARTVTHRVEGRSSRVQHLVLAGGVGACHRVRGTSL